MDQALLTTVAATAGVIAKSLWDLYWKRRGDLEAVARQKRIDFLERQLSLFYWPLYIQLQKNNVVWDHLVNGSGADIAAGQVVTAQLYNSFLLPNHENTLKLIELNIHLAQPDKELEDLLLRFIRHVAIFRALRDGGLKDVDPISVGEPWPKELFPVVERRLRFLQQQFDREIRRENVQEYIPTNNSVARQASISSRDDIVGAAGFSYPIAIEDLSDQRPTRAVERTDTALSHGPAAHR